MPIIQPLKNIFNWQTASEKIPYKVYTAYITVDDNENMYASQVLENTLGAVKFEKVIPTGLWRIVLPFNVPRLKIVIPGFGDFWNSNNASAAMANTDYRMNIYPGFGTAPLYNGSSEPTSVTDCVEIVLEELGSGLIDWRTFFAGTPTGYTTSYPIEIRVYN